MPANDNGAADGGLARALTLGDIRPDTARRFWQKVKRRGPDDCWNWTGSTNSRGYGCIAWGPRGECKSWLAHRVSFVLAGGQLNPSLTLDHLCRNKLCMNPAHLEQVTAAENIKRAARLILHCRQGHPLSGDNMRVDTRGKRICKTCKQAAVRRTYRRARKRKQAMSAGGSTHGSE